MFITFEGIGGSGKTTQARLLYEYLAPMWKTHLTSEPFGGIIGEDGVELIASHVLEPFDELTLVCADRMGHVKRHLRPKLAYHDIVICDRYVDTTMAYSEARDVPEELVESYAIESTCGVMPDITFWLDISVDTAMRRMKSKYLGVKSESKRFYQAASSYYDELYAYRYPERIVRVDADHYDIDDIHKEVLWGFIQRLDSRGQLPKPSS